MELSILNQAGKETGKKIALNDAIFAIEPNDHMLTRPANSVARKAAVALVRVT